MAHKAHLVGALLCLTGCEPKYDLVDLTDTQRVDIQQILEENRRDLPIYTALIERADTAAVFGANGETKAAFAESLEKAQSLTERYFDEGRIYGFIPNDEHNFEAEALLHTSPIEEDQFIGVRLYVSDGEHKMEPQPFGSIA